MLSAPQPSALLSTYLTHLSSLFSNYKSVSENQSKKEMEIFIQAKFENYNLGTASQKALRYTIDYYSAINKERKLGHLQRCGWT